MQQFQIDQEHSNAVTLWKKMGEPKSPTLEQYAQLEKAEQLASMPAPTLATDESGTASANFKLPRQAVSLLVVEWK